MFVIVWTYVRKYNRAAARLLDEEIEKYPFRPDRILPKPYTTASLLAMVKALLPAADQATFDKNIAALAAMRGGRRGGD